MLGLNFTVVLVVLTLFNVFDAVPKKPKLKLKCILSKHPCTSDDGCPERYTCIKGQCCIDQVARACRSGVVGPACSKSDPCKPGYTCKKGYCCRDPVCPKGRTEGGSCGTVPGEPKCAENFECINDFCCEIRRKDDPTKACRSGLVGPACSKSDPCKPGYTCKKRYCCRDPVCPEGRTERGSCSMVPGEPKCAANFECINNFCCEL